MPDIPASSLAAAESAIRDELNSSREVEPNRLARAALEAAAPLLAEGLRDHIDADHAVMVQLGRIADAAVKTLEHISMDTDEDRELHARAVGALRSRLDEMAATIKEANESVCPKCGTAECLEGKALDF
jgi:hypothetical protein